MRNDDESCVERSGDHLIINVFDNKTRYAVSECPLVYYISNGKEICSNGLLN